jgi:mono/diheme cytochrome c family protein
MQIQVKIIIGTVAFMLTMILLGFVALREPDRLRAFAAAEEGRKVENGAAGFQANCATCHGVNGMGTNGGECYDAAGEQIGCVGLQLNNQRLVCGNRPLRLDQQQWLGTPYEYIYGTINTGRPWAGMPTWGQDFGGPLSYNQMDDIANFVLNWANDDLCGQEIVLTVWPASVSELPVGDPANGESLYLGQGCSGCHQSITEDLSGTFPYLGNIEVDGATRKPGYSAADYVYESILLINEYISPNWAVCEGLSEADCQSTPSAMNAAYASQLSLQDMADIMAYLLGSGEFTTDGAMIDVSQVNPDVPADGAGG